MLFQTPEFLIFGLVVFVLLFLVSALRWQRLILLVASLFFYAWWNPLYLPLLVTVLTVAYVVTRLLGFESRPKQRQWLLVAGLCVTLGLLFSFKYANFALESWEALLSSAGLAVKETRLNVVLPVGISFYTFQAISYMIDVYRGSLRPDPSFQKVALYIAFFPQLVAGPIVRGSELLPSLANPVRFRRENLEAGAVLFLRGLIKKVAIADNVAPLVDFVFNNPSGLPSVTIWAAAIGFAIQIYCDFSGYTDMAIGLGRAMGFEFPQNFNWPYFARNPADFWRRWHMTLSRWLRDYLYIPLGGSRKGKLRTYGNLMTTMGLGGLWHGASWNFLLWGLYHGGLLAAHRFVSEDRLLHLPLGERVIVKKAVTVLSRPITLYFTLLGWLFFRVTDLSNLGYVVKKFVLIDGNFNITGIGLGGVYPFTTLALFAGFAVLHGISWRLQGLDRWVLFRPSMVQHAVVLASLVALTLLWPTGSVPFIYFQF